MVVETSLVDRASEIEQRLLQLRDSLDYAGKCQGIEAIESKMAAPDFWGDQDSAKQTVGQLKSLKAVVDPLRELISSVEDLNALLEMAEEDPSIGDEVRSEVERLEASLDDLELQALLNGPNDACGAIMTIHARDGGTDANDWAEMLLRMYLQWAQAQGYEAELVERQDNEEAGINNCTVVFRGPMAYGYLKGETGMHRLVRISPFNSEGKRQTSFAAVDVTPEIDDSYHIEVDWDKDVREDTFRASGAGGQHVNKTSSAIRLTHMPSGVVVQCQAERSQHKNRALAEKMLMARLARLEEEKREAEEAAKYKTQAKTGFGSQIRSYFQHPDQRVKDGRSGHAEGNFHAVLDGRIQEFLDAYLRWRAKENLVN
ncbi:MAG: peptide chain release factor 2 [Planctomycetales bacterium]|nr:peptide chain release factor 2 [Planctomycetales bacterium]